MRADGRDRQVLLEQPDDEERDPGPEEHAVDLVGTVCYPPGEEHVGNPTARQSQFLGVDRQGALPPVGHQEDRLDEERGEGEGREEGDPVGDHLVQEDHQEPVEDEEEDDVKSLDETWRAEHGGKHRGWLVVLWPIGCRRPRLSRGPAHTRPYHRLRLSNRIASLRYTQPARSVHFNSHKPLPPFGPVDPWQNYPHPQPV